MLTAYIDESGQRSRNGASSPHFVMSALVVRKEREGDAKDFLAKLRKDLRRNTEDVLHWKNYNSHTDRLFASSELGKRSDLFKASSVVVCKEYLPNRTDFDHDVAYLYTFRFLLERLSWLARQYDEELEYVLGHVVRFPISKLREYEKRLRNTPPDRCQIDWDHIADKGGRIDQPKRVELLQLADILASATGIAFNPDRNGFTEDRYVKNLLPVTYRPEGKSFTAYGLKMHPWNDNTKAAYPWVAAL